MSGQRTNDLRRWINLQDNTKHGAGIGNWSICQQSVRKLHGPLQNTTPVSGTSQAPGLTAAAGLLASILQTLTSTCSGSRSTDANLQRANAWPNLLPFFLPQPHCHNYTTTPAAFLHLVTHYLDHLWSSTRLESVALSLHSFESSIFNPRLRQVGVRSLPLDPPRHSCALTF
jgi:hypothetical protein